MKQQYENLTNPVIAKWYGKVHHLLPPGIIKYPLKYRLSGKHRKYIKKQKAYAKKTYILNTYVVIQISQGSLLSNKPPLIQNSISDHSTPGKNDLCDREAQDNYLDALSKTFLIRPAMICISSTFRVGCTRNIRPVSSSSIALGNRSAGPNPASVKAFSR
jgi:hypothetical protein